MAANTFEQKAVNSEPDSIRRSVEIAEKNAPEETRSDRTRSESKGDSCNPLSGAPLISVIIPIYNVEPYLRRCLDSVIHNTYKNLEIICVNDGSTDHCLQILKEYAEADRRIRIVDKPNGGVASARNAGFEVATGELISHVDADDWVHKQYFEVLLSAWEKTDRKADVVMCGFTRTDTEIEEADIDIGALNCLVGSWELVKKYPIFRLYVWAKLYKRSLIGDFRQNPRFVMEEDVVYNLNVLGQKEDLVLAYIENCRPYYYFRREESISNTAERSSKIPGMKEMIVSAERIPSVSGRILVWEVLFRKTLRLRFEQKYRDRAYPEEAFDYKNTLKLACDSLQKYRAYSPVKLLGYRILSKYPSIYRLIRILTVPKQLELEKQERLKYKK